LLLVDLRRRQVVVKLNLCRARETKLKRKTVSFARWAAVPFPQPVKFSPEATIRRAKKGELGKRFAGFCFAREMGNGKISGPEFPAPPRRSGGAF